MSTAPPRESPLAGQPELRWLAGSTLGRALSLGCRPPGLGGGRHDEELALSQPTTDVGRLGASTASRLRASAPPSLFAAVVAVFSVALIVYLVLENAIWGWLTGPAYWSIRLLPDAFICALAALTLVHAFRAPVDAGVAAAVVRRRPGDRGLDTIRGHSPVDSINAVRLVLRYVVLGIVLAIWIRDPRGLDGESSSRPSLSRAPPRS